MAKENKDTEFKLISLRVPVEVYAQYKVTLRNQGKIPTYDIINHMKSVINENKKEMINHEN